MRNGCHYKADWLEKIQSLDLTDYLIQYNAAEFFVIYRNSEPFLVKRSGLRNEIWKQKFSVL